MAEKQLTDRLRAAFDGDDVAEKNICLRLAHDALLSRPAAPKCAECGGIGQVSRAWGYIPCDACGGKGF